MSQTGTLNAKKRKALAALLACSTARGAAKAAGIGERTIWRYLGDPLFKRELRDLQDKAIMAAAASLSGLTGEAIETLRDVLSDAEASHSVKVRCALGILQERRRIGELDDLSERVGRLEEALRK